MQLAFCLYKYFPYGGLQRDFLRIAQLCQTRGHQIRVYALQWQGDVPDGFERIMVPVAGWSNTRRYKRFTAWVQADLARRPVDRVVGFNKMPGLDVYYAADPCFEDKARHLRKPFYRLTPRYRHFAAYERAVFGIEAKTEILSISPVQQALFQKYYGTPLTRFHAMPPGIAPDRRAPANATQLRAEARARFGSEFGLHPDDLLLVQIGSDFPRKGLDRSLAAMAVLPDALRQKTKLVALGSDDPRPFIEQARGLGVEAQVFLPGGRDDVPAFLLGADALLHPARHENTGTVLLEALAAGLPVLAGAVCGYAHYITEADAGLVVPEPFEQQTMNAALRNMLEDDERRRRWHLNALKFADETDLYSLPEKAADIIEAA